MAWYHQYQFAEIIDTMYPDLKGIALPIVRYEIKDAPARVVAVEVFIKGGQNMWFTRRQVRLYMGSEELILRPEQRESKKMWERFLRKFNLKKGGV